MCHHLESEAYESIEEYEAEGDEHEEEPEREALAADD